MSTRTVVLLLFCWLRMASVDTMGGRAGLLPSRRSISVITVAVSCGTIWQQYVITVDLGCWELAEELIAFG